jgi:hypothetical protein
MISTDIILQGPVYPYTEEIANHYSTLPFVNCVIVSGWKDSPVFSSNNPRVFQLYNDDVSFPGSWNRNRLIKSSYEGLKVAPSEYAIKMRTDQIASLDSMMKLYHYYHEKKDSNLKRLDGATTTKIGVMGICSDFPYHPIDHILWGRTQDLIDFFDIPYDMTWHDEKSPENKDKCYGQMYTRAEVYITTPYISKFSTIAQKHLADPDKYLKEVAENMCNPEALVESKRIMDDIFLVFPPFQLQWPKNGMNQYHYDVMATYRGGHAYWATDKDFR